MKNFPSKLNGRNIYINAAVARSGNNFVAWFWWLKRTILHIYDNKIIFLNNFAQEIKEKV